MKKTPLRQLGAHTFYTTAKPPAELVLWLCGGREWCPRTVPSRNHLGRQVGLLDALRPESGPVCFRGDTLEQQLLLSGTHRPVGMLPGVLIPSAVAGNTISVLHATHQF